MGRWKFNSFSIYSPRIFCHFFFCSRHFFPSIVGLNKVRIWFLPNFFSFRFVLPSFRVSVNSFHSHELLSWPAQKKREKGSLIEMLQRRHKLSMCEYFQLFLFYSKNQFNLFQAVFFLLSFSYVWIENLYYFCNIIEIRATK